MQLVTVVIFICLSWMSRAMAHEPGQEFTYLSMFQVPGSPEGFTKGEKAALASEYLRRRPLQTDTRRQRLRRLQSESRAQRSEESLDDDEDSLPSSPSDNNGRTDEEQTEDTPRTDERETGDFKGEEIEEEEAQSEDIEVSTRDDSNRLNDTPQNESAQEAANVEVPRHVVHAVEDLTHNEPETDTGESSTSKQLETTKTETSITKDVKGSRSRKLKAPLSEILDSKDPKVLAVVKEGNRNGEDLKRLSMMLMKIIKQYKVKSLVDVPCRAHSHWMPIFLSHIAQSKLKKYFKYYCVDTNKAILKIIKGRSDSEINSKFILKRFWTESLPSADVVFSWSGLDNMKEENVVKYLEQLSVSKHKLVLLGSHSGQLEKEGSTEQISHFTLGGKPLNFRREPFKLAKPMRIVGDLSTEGNDKQLYVYEPKGMMQSD